MNIKAKYLKISLSEIDLENRTYSLTPSCSDIYSNLEDDQLDLRAITHPPLVLEKTHTKYLIITGRQIIYDISNKEASHSCQCLVIPKETEPEKILALALEDILVFRQVSAAEQAICWHKAVKWFGEERAKNVFADRLSLLNKYSESRLTALAELGEKTLDALQQGNLDLKVAFRLVDLKGKDRNCLFEIIHILHLSNSNQKKLLDLCNELHHRNHISICEILSGDECINIINHPEANPPQKTAMLMKWLGECCYPRMTLAEAEFRKFIGKLDLPKGVSIDHALSFEDDTLSLTLDYRDQETLYRDWPKIKELFEINNKY